MAHLLISLSFCGITFTRITCSTQLPLHSHSVPSLERKRLNIAQVSPPQWPLACWDCGFESRRGRGCLFLVIAVFYQLEISASSGTLVHRSPMDCGVSACDRETSIMGWPPPTTGCCTMGEKMVQADIHFLL
jgi:hypothetical protein